MYDTIIRDVSLITQDGWQVADLAIDNGRFAEIGSITGGAKATVKGDGLFCFPGGIDLHVHFNEPGRTHWEGFSTGSLAAAAGGCTYVAEMPLNSIPSTTTVSALDEKLKAIGNKSHGDFGLWGGLVPGNVDDLPRLADAGGMAFKAFMSPSGTNEFENSDVATLRAGMKAIAKTGKRLALHAEDPAVLQTASAKLASRQSAFDWEASRPVEAEISAIQIAVGLASETGCPLHIVHISAPEAAQVVRDAQEKGVNVTCETCPHYLLLSIEQAASIGPDAKCAPPLRPAGTVKRLHDYLRNGYFDTIGSDHSPCPPEMKAGLTFFEAWGGISGLQHGLPLLWNHYIADPKLLYDLTHYCSGNPAKIANLPGKGSIEVGKDADFALVERTDEPKAIASDELLNRHGTSAYCGLNSHFKIIQTWLRGVKIFSNGCPSSEPSGKFIRAS